MIFNPFHWTAEPFLVSHLCLMAIPFLWHLTTRHKSGDDHAPPLDPLALPLVAGGACSLTSLAGIIRRASGKDTARAWRKARP